MDFTTNRATQSSAVRSGASTSGHHSNSSGDRKSSAWMSSPGWLRVIWVVLLFSGTVLVIAIAALLYFGGPNQTNYIDRSKVQAVFLTNGQVYFGRIQTANREFVDLREIYYLSVNQTVQPETKDSQNNTVSLVKLGCELHGPEDQMVINREQVSFWENLKTDGQVTKAIIQWQNQNPDGQKCNTTTSNNSSTDKKSE